MSFLDRRALLAAVSICKQSKRFRGKINIQKPQKPFFTKALYLEVTKPYIINPVKVSQAIPTCNKHVKTTLKTEPPPNQLTLEKIYARELYDEFKSSKMIIFFHLNPTSAEDNYNAYSAFYKQKMFLKQYGKKTMEMALTGTPYEPVLDSYISHNMILFSPEVAIKGVLKIAKKFPHLILLSGIVEGRFLCKDELVYYSGVPNLQTAQMQLVQTLNAAGATVVRQLGTHQMNLVAQLGERIKQLEGEEKK